MKSKITDLSEEQLDKLTDFLDTLPECNYSITDINMNNKIYDVDVYTYRQDVVVSIYKFLMEEGIKS